MYTYLISIYTYIHTTYIHTQCAHLPSVLYLEGLRVLDVVDSWTALEKTTTTLRSHREADGEARRKGSGLSSLLLYAESGASDSSTGTVVMEGVMST